MNTRNPAWTLCILSVAVACGPPPSPATPPGSTCVESKTVTHRAPGVGRETTYAEFPVRVERSERREVQLETSTRPATTPLGLGGRTSLWVGAESAWPDNGAEDCDLRARTDSPRLPLPADWYRAVALHDVFTVDGRASIAVFTIKTDVHAERVSRRSPGSYLAVLHRRGSDAQLLAFPFADQVVRLSDGTIVVGQRGRDRVEYHAYDETRGLVRGRHRNAPRGSVSIDVSGTVSRFPNRFRDLTGWGVDRVWATTAGRRRVVALDPTGAVLVSRYFGSKTQALMPFRQGVWVRFRDSSRSLGLRGETLAQIEHPRDARLAVDADGLIYVVTEQEVVAYERDGQVRWRDHLDARAVSNPVLSPEFGLCVALDGPEAKVVCYVPAGTDTMR